MDPARYLRVYRFEGGVRFDGEFMRALEELEVADDAGLHDALFVRRVDAGDELEAIDLSIGRADGTISVLLDFRLEPSSRQATTQRTLAAHPGGVPAPVVKEVGASLPAGGAVLAVLVSGTASQTLEDAVTASGGRSIADTTVTAATLAEVAPQLQAAL